MKKVNIFFRRTIFPGIIVTALLLLGFLLPASGQELNGKIKLQLETLTTYVISADDYSDSYLELLGFKRPANIAAEEWKALPALRKVEIAYRTAEINNQGKEFIESLCKVISRDYNSIKSEAILKGYFSGLNIPVIKFGTIQQITDVGKTPLPASVKAELLTVGKYINEGALGSMQNVFRNYFDLEEDVIFDILTKYDTKAGALEQGLARSKVPPPHEEKIKNIANDLQKSYKSLGSDLKLAEISKRNARSPYSFADNDIKPEKIDPSLLSPGDKPMELNEYKNEFRKSYAKHRNYEKVYTNKSRNFKAMKNFKGGHGGVILGENVLYPGLPKLTEMRWVPINVLEKDDSKKIGYLELYFHSMASYRSFGPVRYEDVFVSNIIVNDTSYKYGNGIGMVSIIDTSNLSFSTHMRRFGITLHPAVSHMQLGWAMVIADAFAISRSGMEKILTEPSDQPQVDAFYKEENSTWKVTDRPITFKSAGKNIRTDDIVLTMWGFKKNDELPTESAGFRKLLPGICKSVEEFQRVNEFAKVFALFRWAQKVNCRVSGVNTYNSFISQPVCLYSSPEGALEFYNRQTDAKQFESERAYYRQLLEYNKNGGDNDYGKKIDSLYTWFDNISASRKRLWDTAITATAENDVNLVLAAEDSSGLRIIHDLQTNFKDQWEINTVKHVLVDSLAYYSDLKKRIRVKLAPVYSLEKEKARLRMQMLQLFDRYKIRKEKDFQQLPIKQKQVLGAIFIQLETINRKEILLANDKEVKEGLALTADAVFFEYRNRISGPDALYLFMQAERKALTDYGYK